MLHLIFSAPLETAILQRIGKNDAILFLENAVLCLLKNSKYQTVISELLADCRVFVLKQDIETRGIHPDELMPNLTVIEYADWVDLTVQHPKVQSWF